jgi:hypothetical protein
MNVTESGMISECSKPLKASLSMRLTLSESEIVFRSRQCSKAFGGIDSAEST